MKVLALSDIHGAVDQVEAILSKEDGYDLVLVAGDITDTAEQDYQGAARNILERLDEAGQFLKAVPGNMDDESILKLLIENRVNLHKNIFSMGEYEFIGFGGGRTPPGVDTPFEPGDAERGQVLEQLLQRTKADRQVVVSHEPPEGTAADQTSGGDHVGSAALREL
ncbi:MAG: metallophosphoesterase, partial [Candidatus Nanohaloarchaea archaeon]|nr:metallophosphoesterase [Candidatus Nanohaloarchaea archaeon]